MPIILDGTTGITTPGITNTGTFVFQGPIQVPAGTVGAPSVTTDGDTNTGIYFPAADTIAFAEGGVEALRINSSAQIAVNTAGTAGAPVITKTDDLNTGIFFPAADTIAFAEGGVEAMRLDSAGNVGIGVTPTNNTLGKTIQNGQAAVWVSETASNRFWLGSNWYFSSGDKYINNGFATLYSQQSGQHQWLNAGSGTAGNTITFTQAMTLSADGNLGIGATSPANYAGYKNFVINGTSGGNIDLNVNGTRTLALTSTATENYVASITNIPLLFLTNNTERMRIANSGDVGIGTNNPTARLNVAGVGAANNPAFAVDVSTSSTFVHAQENFAANITSGQTALIVLGREGSSKNSGYLGYRYSGTPGSNDNLLTLGHWAADNLVNLNGAGNLMVGGTTVLQSAILSAYGSIAARNGGVDGTYANAFIAQYNQNNNEHNVIQTTVSSSGPNSGFRFRASDGAGAATTTTVLDVTRAQTVFYTSGAERARFASTGVLLLNNTDTSGTAAGQLRAKFSASSYSTPNDNDLPNVTLWNTNNSSTSAHAILSLRTGGPSGGDPFISFDVANEFGWAAGMLNSDNSFRIVNGWSSLTGTGVFITSNGSSWSSTSDERVKDIIEPITNAVSKVSSLRAVIGKYKKDSPDKRRSFLIAQDVDKVLPEAVDKNNEGEWGLSYTDTIPLLVAAIKELKAELDALKGSN